ncbi:4a-hydroxytetrahydrobiopterin dehydratase [Streptomyces sp. NPDC059262]|uniref:4a-hydroxytetrahydrobiopterin dehydratase n=1 Tax=Streptomyces sp. NPDC059262 TaxID=3346797 RepID=UPI0036CF8CE0
MANRLDDAEVDKRMSNAHMVYWLREGDTLRRTVEVYDFATAVNVVGDVVYDVNTLARCPDVDIRGKQVTFVIRGEDGLTDVDVELAHRIETAAGSHVRGNA